MSVTDHTYLDTAVDRIQGMFEAKLATFDPPTLQIVNYLDPDMIAPFVWLYPGRMNNELFVSGVGKQVYTVVARWVIGMTTEGFQGVQAAKLWLWLPALACYFNEHRNLVYAAGQSVPLYLHPDGARMTVITPFGNFAGTNHLGMEFGITVPFQVDEDEQQ